jgi:hypothetical protein
MFRTSFKLLYIIVCVLIIYPGTPICGCDDTDHHQDTSISHEISECCSINPTREDEEEAKRKSNFCSSCGAGEGCLCCSVEREAKADLKFLKERFEVVDRNPIPEDNQNQPIQNDQQDPPLSIVTVSIHISTTVLLC